MDIYLQHKYRGRANDFVSAEMGAVAPVDGDNPIYECPDCGEEQLVYDADKGRFHCFACDVNYTSEDFGFCERCGSLMPRDGETAICRNCIESMGSE